MNGATFEFIERSLVVMASKLTMAINQVACPALLHSVQSRFAQAVYGVIVRNLDRASRASSLVLKIG
tara:strand:- start:27 stop:227 length:201 start_codon:yes stop_codon:yes gene_type:complete